MGSGSGLDSTDRADHELWTKEMIKYGCKRWVQMKTRAVFESAIVPSGLTEREIGRQTAERSFSLRGKLLSRSSVDHIATAHHRIE